MNLLNLFEDNNSTPNPNYAEELAYQIFKVAPNLDTTGAADEVLDYAFDLAVNDLGRKRAHSLFAYDEDFDSDLVNAYLDLQMNKSAEDKKQVNEVDPRNFDSDEDYYAAQNAPAKRRSAPSDYPYSPEEDDAYFREIFRKKREAAKKAEQDKQQGVAESAESLAEWEARMKKLGYKITKDNKAGTYHAWQGTTHKGSHRTQGVAEGQLNEYLVRAGMPVKDVLELNLFQDTSPDGQEGMANDPRWSRLMKRYQPIANMLAKKIMALGKNRRLSDAEAEAVEEVWYDGSDAYEDMEVEYLADYYDMQIATVEAIIAGELQDEMDEGQQWPDSSNSLAKRSAVATNLKGAPSKAGRGSGMTVATRVEPTIPPTSVKRLGGDGPIPSFLQKGVAEGQEVDASVVIGKLYDVINHAEDIIKNADYDRQVQYATTLRDRATNALNMIKQGGNTPEAALDAFAYMQTGKQGVAEGEEGSTEFYVYIGREGDGGWIGRISKDGGKWREEGGEGNKPHNWGTAYMSYLTPDEVMQWIRQDYRRHEVAGPFLDDAEAYEYAEQMGGLDESVAEADKKKEDDLEPQVKDVALQRAISRAKADFPTAGTGIEALAKDFMRSQDQDSKSFDQLRQAERKQDQMLGQITKIDQEQEQEIQDIENQNSTLASRLQQLQNVNGNLEKKLAAMSGRKAEKKSSTDDVSVAPAPTTTKTVEPAAKPKIKSKNKSQPAKSSMKSTAAQLAAPKADPMAAMTNRITKGDSSVIDRVSGQSALPFEPSDNVLEPVIPQAQQNPRFAAARANASDVDVRYGRELADRIKQQMADAGKASPDYPDAERLRAMKKPTVENDDQEAKYGDKYQDMVARVGQKAREQEKSKPVDIKDLARRLAAIEASRKD